ncbi:MAG: YIP1 family protein [Brevundimonas sp.]|nr:MAG: YIP1 family protein [Brevundimonas sp.]
MTLEAAAAPAPSIVERAQEILFRPTQAWQRISGEATTTQKLMAGYAAPLAAIGPICGLIGSQFFPLRVFGAAIRTPLVGAVTSAVLSFAMALVGVYVLGRIIEAVAPNFGAEKDRTAAMKVAVYSSTASWLCGVFSIFPLMAVLGLLGLYSLFLLYRGLPIVMKAPADKATGYAVTVVVAAIVIFFAIAMVVGAVGAAITATAVGAAGYGF